jgi:hypothetical protein
LLQQPNAVAKPIFKRKPNTSVATVAARHWSVTQGSILPITIDASMVTPLRHAVIAACGEMLSFLRIQPVARSDKVKVWLCLPKSAMHVAMAAVMRALPAAEFGRITPVGGASVPVA